MESSDFKIFMTGDPGVRKSTTARALSEKLEIPVFHADNYRTEGSCKFTPYERFKKIIEKIMAENPSYIIDICSAGDDMKFIEKLVTTSDIVIDFQFPTAVALKNWAERTESFTKGATHLGSTHAGIDVSKYGTPQDFIFFLEYYAGFIAEREKRKPIFDEHSSKVIKLYSFEDVEKLLAQCNSIEDLISFKNSSTALLK
jgi:adenylate kinase family enzyme